MNHKSKTFLTQAALIAACVSVTGLAHSQSNRAAITKTVAGPVTVRVKAISADFDVAVGKAKSIEVVVTNSNVSKVTVKKKGSAYKIGFGGQMLRSGRVTIRLPAGSGANIGVVSGDIKVKGIGGNVKLRTVSGDVKVSGAGNAEVLSVSGDVKLKKITGSVTAKTVSGDLHIESTGKANSKLVSSTTSGDLHWVGRCGKGCSMRLNTLSGRLQLSLDKASSFKVSYSSFSGSFKDALGIKTSKSGRNQHGGRRLSGTYGSGAGKIKARSFSGKLKLKKK